MVDQLFRTFETVDLDTPASVATSEIVTAISFSLSNILKNVILWFLLYKKSEEMFIRHIV